MALTSGDLSLDWADFEAAGRASRRLLHDLTKDPGGLRERVLSVGDDDDLLGRCARVDGIDCIVLSVGLDDSRLELQSASGGYARQPHDSPFSFSTYILVGGWAHTWYAAPPEDRDPKQAGSGDGSKSPAPYVTRFEQPGSCYSVHHSVIHGLETSVDTVALALCGPVQREKGTEGRGHRSDPMSATAYEEATLTLERHGII